MLFGPHCSKVPESETMRNHTESEQRSSVPARNNEIRANICRQRSSRPYLQTCEKNSFPAGNLSDRKADNEFPAGISPNFLKPDSVIITSDNSLDKVSYNPSVFDRLWNFQNLYQAHRKARRSKRHKKEVILFEKDLAQNLTLLSRAIHEGSYRISGYYNFFVYEPKKRNISALHYVDRVVQHCLCDEILAPEFEKRLIYDNVACRIGKGLSFALKRLTVFLTEYFRQYGNQGYFLRCDIRKYFDSVDHDILKAKLKRIITDERLIFFLENIIDSYETIQGKGIPMGNQTSQWFAIYYLDGFDRIIKERFRIKHYLRYMDDCVIIHHDRQFLQGVKHVMEDFLEKKLKLSFNEKTQIFPIKNGVDFLGFNFKLSDRGKVVRRIRPQVKRKFRRRISEIKKLYASGRISAEKAIAPVISYNAHLKQGHTGNLRCLAFRQFVLKRNEKSI